MRRLIYSVACSLDGYIARDDRSPEWIPQDQDYGLGGFFKTVDTVLVGRRTHDFMCSFGKPVFPGMTTIAFTRNAEPRPFKGLRWVTSDAIGFVRELKNQPGRDLWLMGGSSLAQTFFEARLMDEVSLKVVPILLGHGIPLFRPFAGETALHLIEHKVFSSGVVSLRYEPV